MTPVPDPRAVAALRRELVLACDHDGCVTWADQAAEALLERARLEELGYEVHVAADGFEGLDAARLPGLDGYQLARTLVKPVQPERLAHVMRARRGHGASTGVAP